MNHTDLYTLTLSTILSASSPLPASPSSITISLTPTTLDYEITCCQFSITTSISMRMVDNEEFGLIVLERAIIESIRHLTHTIHQGHIDPSHNGLQPIPTPTLH